MAADPVAREILAVRRAHHETRGAASVEHATADSRLWLLALGTSYGRLVASLGPLDAELAEDPRDALLGLLADCHAFLIALDERPGLLR